CLRGPLSTSLNDQPVRLDDTTRAPQRDLPPQHAGVCRQLRRALPAFNCAQRPFRANSRPSPVSDALTSLPLPYPTSRVITHPRSTARATVAGLSPISAKTCHTPSMPSLASNSL